MKYERSTHRDCNVNKRLTPKIPFFFHNLKGYDSNHIFKGLRKCDLNIGVISNGLEYI